jgi:hypothetical protein
MCWCWWEVWRHCVAGALFCSSENPNLTKVMGMDSCEEKGRSSHNLGSFVYAEPLWVLLSFLSRETCER